MADDLTDSALRYHRLPKPGKLEIVATKPMATQRDLALAYSPGVATASLAVAADPAEAANLTARQKELLTELAASLGETQTPRNTSFAGKAKRFWADILGGDADNPKETA